MGKSKLKLHIFSHLKQFSDIHPRSWEINSFAKIGNFDKSWQRTTLISAAAKSLESSLSAPANWDTFDKLIALYLQRETPAVSAKKKSPRLTSNVSDKSMMSAIKTVQGGLPEIQKTGAMNIYDLFLCQTHQVTFAHLCEWLQRCMQVSARHNWAI